MASVRPPRAAGAYPAAVGGGNSRSKVEGGQGKALLDAAMAELAIDPHCIVDKVVLDKDDLDKDDLDKARADLGPSSQPAEPAASAPAGVVRGKPRDRERRRRLRGLRPAVQRAATGAWRRLNLSLIHI